MGVSSDAIIFYGYSFDDEGPIWKQDEDCEPSDYEDAIDAALELSGRPYAVRSEARDALGVEFVHHCHADCPMYAVAITSSVVTAYRGDLKEVSTPAPDPSWQTELDRFCELLGVDVAGKKPGWYLVSYSDFS